MKRSGIYPSRWRTIMQSAALILTFLITAATAHAGQAERLYVIDCGSAEAADQSIWSPGVNVGVPIEFSDNCYLIHHSTGGYLLWDTGITDRLAALPAGTYVPPLRETWRRRQTLVASLAAIGVTSSDIRYVALSHIHPDHAGNVEEFPNATVIMQKAEWDYAMTLPQKPISPDHKTLLLEGDEDLFVDGSVVFLSTPGHTPGHQSLLVRLPRTGTVLLSGDAVHFKDNWDNRRVPAINTDQDQTLAAMQRIATFLANQQASLWINHDKPSSDARRRAPQFYD